MGSKLEMLLKVGLIMLLLCGSIWGFRRAPGFPQALVPPQFMAEDGISLSDSDFKYPVNNIGNTKAQGRFFGDDNYLYGLIFPGFHFFNLGMRDYHTGNSVVLLEDRASNIVFSDGYIFFMKTDIVTHAEEIYGNGSLTGIYKMNVETKELAKIVQDTVSCFYIYNNLLFYQVSTSDTDTRIKRCSLDGENGETLLKVEENIADLFFVYNDRLVLPLSDNSLLVYDMMNECMEKIDLSVMCTNIGNVIPTKYGIVFLAITPQDQKSSIWIYDFSSHTSSELVDGQCRNLIYNGKTLYYITEENGEFLCSIDIKSKSKKYIISLDEFDYTVDMMNVIGNQAFCTTNYGRGSDLDNGIKLFVVDLLTGKWIREY